MLETQPGTRAIAPRRVSGSAKPRREMVEDFSGNEADLPVRARRSQGVRITLPDGLPITTLKHFAIVITVGILLGGFAVALWQMRHFLLCDSQFFLASSSSIQIIGNEHVTRAQVLSVFDDEIEHNILSVSLADRREELERLPWVKHATVMRLLPNRLLVAISERSPVAFYRQGRHLGLVDQNGVLLDLRQEISGITSSEPKYSQHYSFPVVSGLTASDPLPMRAARMKMFDHFMRDLQGSEDRVTDRLSEVDLSSQEDVKALIPTGSGSVLVHFGEDHFLERYRRFEQNLPKWMSDYPKMTSADMRYDRQVVLEMEPGTAIPVASGRPNVQAASKAGAELPAGHESAAHTTQSKHLPADRTAAFHARKSPFAQSTVFANHLPDAGPQ